MAKKIRSEFEVIDKATKKLTQIGRKFNGVQESVNKFAGAATKLFVGGAIISGAVNGIRRMIDESIAYGAEVVDMAAKTGATVEEVQLLGFMAKQVGGDMSNMTKFFKALGRAADEASVGVAEYKDEFDRLGVSVRRDDGTMKGLTDLFFESANAIGKLEGSVERAAAASNLFGRSGQEVLAMLAESGGDLQKFADRFEQIGGAISAIDLQKMKDASDTMTDWETVTKRMGVELTSTFMPTITAVVSKMAELAGLMRGGIVADIMQKEKEIAQIEAKLGRGGRSRSGANEKILETRLKRLREGLQMSKEIREEMEAEAAAGAEASSSAAARVEAEKAAAAAAEKRRKKIADEARKQVNQDFSGQRNLEWQMVAPSDAQIDIEIAQTDKRNEALRSINNKYYEQLFVDGSDWAQREIEESARRNEKIEDDQKRHLHQMNWLREQEVFAAQNAALAMIGVGIALARANADSARNAANVAAGLGMIQAGLSAAFAIRNVWAAPGGTPTAKAFESIAIAAQAFSSVIGYVSTIKNQKFQQGGIPGGPALVGENGPEMFFPDRRGRVASNSEVRQSVGSSQGIRIDSIVLQRPATQADVDTIVEGLVAAQRQGRLDQFRDRQAGV